jgi:hypothetical protein
MEWISIYGDSVDIRIGMDLRHGGDLNDIQYGMDRPEPVDYGISGRHGSGGRQLANPIWMTSYGTIAGPPKLIDALIIVSASGTPQ